MGFDAGISINKFNKSKSSKIGLYFLGRLNHCLDFLIYSNCSGHPETIEYGEPIIPKEGPAIVQGYEIKSMKNEGYEYTFTLEDIKPILDAVRPVYKICIKYSDRVVDELEDYIDGYKDEKPSEVSDDDISKLKDALYKISEDGDVDYPEVHKVLHVYNVFSAIAQLEDEMFEEGVSLFFPNADEDELEEELMDRFDKMYDYD